MFSICFLGIIIKKWPQDVNQITCVSSVNQDSFIKLGLYQGCKYRNKKTKRLSFVTTFLTYSKAVVSHQQEQDYRYHKNGKQVLLDIQVCCHRHICVLFMSFKEGQNYTRECSKNISKIMLQRSHLFRECGFVFSCHYCVNIFPCNNSLSLVS